MCSDNPEKEEQKKINVMLRLSLLGYINTDSFLHSTGTL